MPQILDIKELQQIVLRSIAIFNERGYWELVLKGGSALEMFYNHPRYSQDMDFSISAAISDSSTDWKQYIEELINIFKDELSAVNHIVVTYNTKPPKDGLPSDFGRTFQMKIKITHHTAYTEARLKCLKKANHHPVETCVAERISKNPTTYRTVHIDISDKEYTEPAVIQNLPNGYTIKVYTPVMIICEKLRAICQNTTQYLQRYNLEPRTSRVRDFFDIYHIQEKYSPSWKDKDNLKILQEIFRVKNMPISLLNSISLLNLIQSTEVREINYTKRTWQYKKLKDTVKTNLEDFEFYYSYVVKLTQEILDNISSICGQTEDPL